MFICISVKAIERFLCLDGFSILSLLLWIFADNSGNLDFLVFTNLQCK